MAKLFFTFIFSLIMKVLFTLHTPLLMPDIYINNFQDTPFAYTRYIHKDRMVSGTLVFLDRLIFSFSFFPDK